MIARWLAPLFCVLLTPALPAADLELPEIPVEQYRLPNGLKVVLSKDTNIPRVTVCVAYHVGSKNERPGRTGFAHFFEHMMFRGTKHVPNFDIPLQEAGSVMNAFTTEDMTVYFETVPSNYLERALYLEAERLGHLPSALDQEKFDTEREVVKNERRQNYENVPYGLASETIQANLFPEGHPYSWSVIGSMADLDQATLDDLRRFFDEYYHTGNATLAVVGDFDIDETKQDIETYFGPLAPGPNPPKVEAPESPTVDERITLADNVQLPRVYWSWPTVADDHPDAPALALLASILSDGEASRLYQALLLDRQLASDVSARSDTSEVAGSFLINATTGEGVTVEQIEEVLAEELERIRSEAPSPDEVERALAKLESAIYTSHFVGLVSSLGRAIALATSFAQKDDPLDFVEDLKRTFQVTPDDIQRVAKTYLTPEKLVLVVRPTEPGEPQTPAVLAGPKPSAEPEEPVEISERVPADSGLDWSVMPAPSEPRPFQGPDVAKQILSNGLEVWFAPWTTLPIASVQLLLPGGTGDDPQEKAGLATLTSRLLDQGTKELSAVELAEELEALGIRLSVGAASDWTVVSFSPLTRNFPSALDLLEQVLTAPRFDPSDIERERQLLLTDLLQGPDRPTWIAARAFRALLYGKEHPYGQPVDGTVKTVRAIERDDLLQFVQDHFSPRGAKLIVVGDIEQEPLMELLETKLGSWTGPDAEPQDRPEPQVSHDPGVVYLVDKPGAVQSVLSVGRRFVGRDDPRYHQFVVGNRVLGGDFRSRINQNLRERHGYTYGARSYFSYRQNGSVWLVSTSVRDDATAPALREVLNELEALAENQPFTTEEITTARDAEIQGFPQTFESPRGIAGALAEIAQFGLPIDYLDTVLEGLQETDFESVTDAMLELVEPDTFVILIVGDRSQVEPELRKLGFESIRPFTPDGDPFD